MTAPVRDLWLWETLDGSPRDPAELERALSQLRVAARPLRSLLSGGLPRLAHHPDARVRRAVIAALHEMYGSAAQRAICELLDDDDAAVRTAAVAEAAQHGDVLASIALFHRRADVRAALLDGKHRVPWTSAALLLADAKTRAKVIARLDRDATDPEIATGLLRAATLGLLERFDAKKRLEALPWHEPARVLAALRPMFVTSDRDLESPQAITATMARPWRSEALVDVLHLCCKGADGLLADDAPILVALVRAFQTNKLAHAEHRRVATSVLAAGMTLGHLPPRALALTYAIAPGALLLEAIPEDERKRGVRALVDVVPVELAGRPKLKELPAPLIVSDGKTDALALAGALRLVEAAPYGALDRLKIDRAALVLAVAAQPRAAAPLVAIPPKSAEERPVFERLVEDLSAIDLPPRALGAFVLALPNQAKETLEKIEKQKPGRAEEMLVGVAEALAHLDADAANDALLEVKVQRATGTLAPQVPKEALPRLICDVVALGAASPGATPAAGPARAAMPVVAALVRAAGPGMADAVCDAVEPAGTRALMAHLDDMVLTARLERTYAFRLKKSADPEVSAWGVVRAEAKAEAVVLEDESAHELLAAPDAAIVDVAEDPLHKSVSGLAEVLLARASMPTSPLVCAAALCLADPLHQSAAVFQRAVDEQPAFLARIDAALLAPKVREDLPLLATAWLHTVPQHALRFEQAARHMTLATLLELALELPAPLLSIKMTQAVIATARTWALMRRVWLDRQADTKHAQRVFSLIVRAARPRPPEAGTSTVDAWLPMRLAAIELLLIAQRAGGACKTFVDDVVGQLKALNPILEPPIVAALAPILTVRSTESEPAAAAPAPAPASALRDSEIVEREFAAAIASGDVTQALALACEETTAWLVPEHVAQLNARVDGRALALALAASPHPAAHTKSVYALDAMLRADPADAAATAGLLTFLRAGDDRARELRLFACEALARVGVMVPFVWMRTGLLDIKETDEQRVYWFDHVPDVDIATWQRVVDAALVAGSEIDELVLPLVRAAWLDDDALALLARHLLMSPDLEDEDARMLFLWVRRARRYDDERVRDLKDAVRWGIRQARILLGKPVGVELVHNAWGYTMLSTPRVYVNPLPILRDERGGVDVVKGLLVHEIGHHLYHADPESRAVWDTAHKAQLGSLLNLVADEHLERNLRSVSPIYGDALKTLCSHAFQHANHDVILELLLDVLGARAFEVLTQIEMRPGKRYGSVNIDVGHLLAQSAGSGGSFARFVRALRQGLGVRDSTSDEKVKEALALFNKKTFRGATMAQMFEIAKELKRIFGDEVKMLNAVGMHEVMESEESDVLAEGVSPEELKEMDRRYKHGPARGRPVFNKGTDEAFETIDEIVVLAHEPLQHNALAMQSRKASAVLRRALLDLGVRVVIERRRVSGRSIDRAGLANAVAKLDPRILTKRTITPAPDLFIGVVVDCSGSMQRQGSMERGRLFATLIAEAARGVPGVDVRLLGFTDSIIYDAGDEERCAAHAFEADGGNNDAAGLWHAAMLAKQSKRRARLLVMVSDGLPTECTMGALKSLVNRLERAGNCCAQVAVQQLADHAFRHYVEILDDDIDAAARKFSRVVTKLVKSVVR